MRTLTACLLTLGIGVAAQPVWAAARADAGPALRGAAVSAAAPARQATFVRKQGPTTAKRSHPVDLDGDGIVSREEARAYYGWLFGMLDRNGDGVIAKLEFIRTLGPGRVEISLSERSAKVERLGVLFARLDKDGTERITEREFMAACDNHFSSADADGDGIVTVEEFGSRQAL